MRQTIRELPKRLQNLQYFRQFGENPTASTEVNTGQFLTSGHV